MLALGNYDKVLGELKVLAGSTDAKEKAIGNLAFFLEATIKNVDQLRQRLEAMENEARKRQSPLPFRGQPRTHRDRGRN